jgi:hypothetical protein
MLVSLLHGREERIDLTTAWKIKTGLTYTEEEDRNDLPSTRKEIRLTPLHRKEEYATCN